MFHKIKQFFLDTYSIPEQGKTEISKKNLTSLTGCSSVIGIFTIIVLFSINYTQKTLAYYVYYFSLLGFSIITLTAVFIAKKIKKYLFTQIITIITMCAYVCLFIFAMFTATEPDSAMFLFHIILILGILFLDVPPVFYAFINVIYILSLMAFQESKNISFAIIANNALFCIAISYFTFYHRKRTVISIKQKIKIDEQNKLLANTNIELENEVKSQKSNIVRIQNNTIMSLASLVENRDADTGEHVLRTKDYVGLMALQAYLSGNFPQIETRQIKLYIKAAAMHDIGKIVVPDAILKKPGKLTPEEFEIIKKHTIEGGRIVEEVLGENEDKEYVQITKNIATYHHEKYDGSGYPKGLKGEEIPLCARIMAIADVFDALVSPRCYKEPFSVEKALGIITEGAGTHFDPVLAKLFVDAREDVINVLNKYEDEFIL